jgi:hypothetical protein
MNPMSTAPKDGTFIVLFINSGYTTTPFRCEVARYYPQYRPLQPWQNHANDSVFDGGGNDNDLVGWMPVPTQGPEL